MEELQGRDYVMSNLFLIKTLGKLHFRVSFINQKMRITKMLGAS